MMGSAELALEVVDAGELVRHVCAGLRGYGRNRGVGLIVFSTCDGVLVDVPSFSNALFHVVQGVVDVTAPGGQVIVSVRPSTSTILWEVRGEPVLAHTERPSVFRAAAAVVEQHGGHFGFQAARGCGALASMWTPAHWRRTEVDRRSA